MKIITIIVSLLLFFQLVGFCQKPEILVTIDNKKILVAEFQYAYNKNNSKPITTNRDSLIAEVNKFINYKLKVFEAEKKGLNKSDEFINKFTSYRKQLAASFLLRTETFNKLITEAYQRTKYEIRVKHILVKVSKFASPKDTLIAYNKAMNIKTRLINTESFENVAKETSDDPSAALNGGDLWFVKALQTPYKFENYIFSGTKNLISAPIRTKYGYHIIKIIDRRLNKGSYKVAHIYIYTPKNINKQEEKKYIKKIDSLYQRVLKGDDFTKLALKHSDDKGTANNSELPWFETGYMSHKFENATFDLKKNDDISKPVRTDDGWHIIKRINHQKIPKYEQMKDQLKKMILKSDRYKTCEYNLIERFKKENIFSENRELNILLEAVDSTIFEEKWKLTDFINLNGVLFEIGNEKYTKYDFAKSLEKNQTSMFPIPIDNYVNQQYYKFRNKKIIEFGINELSKKNKPYKYLLNEFYDGMLYFNIMEIAIWNKAENDTLKLKRYYKANFNKYNKLLTSDISVFEFNSTSNIKKVIKYFEKHKKQQLTDSILAIKISNSLKGKFEFKKRYIAEEGINDIFKYIVKEYNLGNIEAKQKYIILEKHNTLIYLNTPIAKTKKTWHSYKPQLISDYKKHLDNEWIKDLRLKYRVTINKKALNSIHN